MLDGPSAELPPTADFFFLVSHIWEYPAANFAEGKTEMRVGIGRGRFGAM